MATTIKEYLVALGFRVDANGLQKFEGGIERATKVATNLGEATAAAAVAIGLAVDKMVERYTGLFYQSRQINSSVGSIQAFTFAAGQLGVSAEKAGNAINSFGATLRTNPFLASVFGLKPGGGTIAMFDQLIDKLAKMGKPGTVGYTIAASWAQRFGIDEDTFNLLSTNPGALHAYEADFAKSQQDAGLNPDANAEAARKLGQDINTLQGHLGNLRDAFLGNFVKPADEAVQKIDELVVGFTGLDEVMKTWIASIGGIIAALGGIAFIKAVLSGGGGLAGIAGRAIGLTAATGGVGLGLAALAATLWPKSLNAAEDEETAKRHAAAGIGATRGERNNNPGNILSWGSMPIEGGFAKFPSAMEGLSAMAKLLMTYGANGKNTISSIIGTWAPPTENNTAAYIADIAKRTGFDPDAKLDMTDAATLQKMMDAMITHENGRNIYGPEMESQAIRSRLGGGAPISQSTTINVNGAGDPHATASAVAGVQNRVNADLVRYAGVVR